MRWTGRTGSEPCTPRFTAEKIRRTSKNIILRITGTEQPEEILTLTAHYDSVPQGPGAYDNMAGAAIIMELAHYFAENRPKRTLECIWFARRSWVSAEAGHM